FLVLIGALYAAGAVSLWRRPPEAGAGAVLLIGFTWVPVALIFLISLVTPLFHPRYVFTYALPFYVLIAAGLLAIYWLAQPEAGGRPPPRLLRGAGGGGGVRGVGAAPPPPQPALARPHLRHGGRPERLPPPGAGRARPALRRPVLRRHEQHACPGLPAPADP